MGVPVLMDRLRFGDHICMPLQRAAEQREFAVSFTGAGLRHGHRVFMAVTDPDALRDHLVARLPGAAEALHRGQVQVAASRDTYLADGEFRPDRLVEQFAETVSEARRAGYRGIRIIGDLSSLVPVVPAEALADYETRVNGVYAESEALAVCQYDPDTLGVQGWTELAAAHPGALARTGDEPISHLRARRTPAGVRLVGEASLANRRALPALLAAAGEAPGTFEIDLSELEFADTPALANLLRTAADRAPRPTVVRCGRQHARILAILGADDVPTLTVAAL